jgi:hypothetical protein
MTIEFNENIDIVFIQIQDISGNWQTISQTPNQSQIIMIEMQNQKRQFPNSKIRAVDPLGRLVDIMM